MSINHVIGQQNRLPWRLPADWENFHRLTAGHVFIMGRKSYFNEDALISDRHNFVLTRQGDLPVGPNATAVNSLTKALASCADEPAVFVLGGASVFTEAIKQADRLYLTIVHGVFAGDAFFPSVDWTEWRYEAGQFHPKDEKHEYAFAMNVYQRIRR